MSFDGMDVEQAQGLARQLEGHAQNLGHITSSLTALTMALSQSWHGPASAVFQQQWAAQHHPALNGAARAMSDLHAHLTANIQQQVRASAADVPWTERVWHVIDDGNRFVLGPLDKLRDITGKDYVVGTKENKEYGVVWRQLMKLDHENSFFAYKQSPTLLGFHDNPHVQLAGRILRETHLSTVVKALGPVGMVMGAVSVVGDVQHARADAQAGRYASAGGDLLDATADGLKTSKNPVAYLIGANIVIWKEDFDLASGIDWKQGIPNPFDAETFRDDYVPTFKSIPGQLGHTIVKAFL